MPVVLPDACVTVGNNMLMQLQTRCQFWQLWECPMPQKLFIQLLAVYKRQCIATCNSSGTVKPTGAKTTHVLCVCVSIYSVTLDQELSCIVYEQLTMWTIIATVLPGYLPSVFLGLRSKRVAPVACAMAWHMLVLPVLGAPYSNRD